MVWQTQTFAIIFELEMNTKVCHLKPLLVLPFFFANSVYIHDCCSPTSAVRFCASWQNANKCMPNALVHLMDCEKVEGRGEILRELRF